MKEERRDSDLLPQHLSGFQGPSESLPSFEKLQPSSSSLLLLPVLHNEDIQELSRHRYEQTRSKETLRKTNTKLGHLWPQEEHRVSIHTQLTEEQAGGESLLLGREKKISFLVLLDRCDRIMAPLKR